MQIDELKSTVELQTYENSKLLEQISEHKKEMDLKFFQLNSMLYDMSPEVLEKLEEDSRAFEKKLAERGVEAEGLKQAQESTAQIRVVRQKKLMHKLKDQLLEEQQKKRQVEKSLKDHRANAQVPEPTPMCMSREWSVCG